MHFLFGNILGVSSTDLKLAAIVSALTLAIFTVFYRSILLETFDPIFHRATGGHSTATHLGILCLTVLNLIAALQAMGIVLALGLFLLPAVTAYLWCDRLSAMLLTSAGLAVIGSAAGIFISYHVGLASGASIVLSLGLIFLVSAIASPRYGALGKLWQSRKEGKGVLHSPLP
jgi:zinc/manganese transport system permease protein